MALDKDRLGTAIKNVVLGMNPNQANMTGAEKADLEAFAQAIAGAVVSEIKENADIVLAAADVKVDPGTFKDSLSAPITGIATIQGVTLSAKIK